jgi:hypothetical protein
VSVVEAGTQADCVICYHAVRGNVDGALANDGDFIAVAGRNMMLIKNSSLRKVGNVQAGPMMMLSLMLWLQLATKINFRAMYWTS